ncbi:triosephosphate isomerase [Vulcanimicrobium alpinum]|uniref:Triosephosphate isomerase n=1 Tax=Vulcanimicrobium alpinum TaxID=3016050 RepID=A0AAN2CBF6_UNVUL|nr:triose-phosphate isomerase [Vulcanimicrobium alpinum]BDE07707.1 triosephosphate isomerase [Vulcanimicrobium alpinum]
MSAARRPLIAGNWKMHKTIAQTQAFIADLCARPLPLDDVDAVLCPPFTALAAAGAALAGSRVGLGAQNVSWAEQGALTGEIAPAMLTECGVRWVVIGHSERRAMFGELDERVKEKARIALAHGLTPIVAVGETAEEHAAGIALDKVRRQVRAAFDGFADDEIARCVVAYEPIWAIGTGKADSPEEANAVMGAIRADVPGLRDARILYGGSVKPDNIAAFVSQPHIDGGLVGGASLEPASFAALLEGARKGAAA